MTSSIGSRRRPPSATSTSCSPSRSIACVRKPVTASACLASHEGGEACVCDISDVGVSQPTVSHHLKKLKEAGLLSSERCGTWVYYRVEAAILAAMGELLTKAAAA
ncbi:ArsR/SmtB family transcription factor [Streptomyces xantholiticus]